MRKKYTAAELGFRARPRCCALGRAPLRSDQPWPVRLALPGRPVAALGVAVLGKSVRVVDVHERMHASDLHGSGLLDRERRNGGRRARVANGYSRAVSL